jgi:glutathione synthase/RimK-type ligase-like ATP-grasp enzyme
MNLAKDKVYTYLVLKKAGIIVPRGDFFFTKEYFRRNSYAAGKSLNDAVEYGRALAHRTGYPLIVKPAHLKQSRGVSKVFRAVDLEAAISNAVKSPGQSEFMVIVQEFIAGPEYRVVLVNDRVTACYRKVDRRVVGDGKRSLTELLLGTGNSALGELERRAIEFAGRDSSSVLGQHETIVVDDINSFGAEPVDVESIHSSIVSICKRSCMELGLRYAGVDLRCNDLGNAGRVVIIEVNGNPWLVDYFYSSAQARESVELTYELLLADFLRLGGDVESKPNDAVRINETLASEG